MSTSTSGTLGEVPPLTALKAHGKPYERSATVHNEIGRMLRLPQSDWMAEAPDLHNETVVFLMRRARRSQEELYGLLVLELTKRINRLARRWTLSLDQFTAEEIRGKVEIETLELVLTEQPSPKSDFLEVAFAQFLKRRTIDVLRKHKNSPLGQRGEIVVEPDEDGDAIEGLELVADDGPNPEDILLNLRDGNQRHQLLRTACRAVKVRRHLVAVILHHAHGWPITSKDQSKPDLVTRFGATDGQIRYWIDTALKQMRAALGVKK